MKYLIENKLMSFGGSSKITDEQGKVAYIAKGSIFGNLILKFYKKTIIDASTKKKLFYVRNKFWHKPFQKSAIIYNDKKQKMAIVRTSNLFKHAYEVVGGTQPINVEGTGWNLDITFGDQKVGHIAPPSEDMVKNFFRVTDGYSLEVLDKEDATFLIALVIAIDNIHDQQRRDK